MRIAFGTRRPSAPPRRRACASRISSRLAFSSTYAGAGARNLADADDSSDPIFYVGVPDVAAALQKAESLGGKRVMGPAKNPGTDLVVAHFTDPEGNLIGLAGPA